MNRITPLGLILSLFLCASGSGCGPWVATPTNLDNLPPHPADDRATAAEIWSALANAVDWPGRVLWPRPMWRPLMPGLTGLRPQTGRWVQTMSPPCAGWARPPLADDRFRRSPPNVRCHHK